jgi:hypothetical protein
MDVVQLNIQALIAKTEALNRDDPSPLETIPIKHPQQEFFGLIGKLLSVKPPNSHWVRETLLTAWKFASPFEVEALPFEKNLFKVFQ